MNIEKSLHCILKLFTWLDDVHGDVECRGRGCNSRKKTLRSLPLSTIQTHELSPTWMQMSKGASVFVRAAVYASVFFGTLCSQYYASKALNVMFHISITVSKCCSSADPFARWCSLRTILSRNFHLQRTKWRHGTVHLHIFRRKF